MTGDSLIIKKILNAIDKPVSYQFPRSEGRREGILKDRAFVKISTGATGVPYWDVIDLIRFPNGPDWIRIGYFRQIGERLVWGSQTTFTGPKKEWKKLLIKAAKEKTWFRDLLKEVAEELE